MTSAEMKKIFKDEGIKMWEIAETIGIHEVTFGKWFRHDSLTEEHEHAIRSAIEQIKLDRMIHHKC